MAFIVRKEEGNWDHEEMDHLSMDYLQFGFPDEPGSPISIRGKGRFGGNGKGGRFESRGGKFDGRPRRPE